MDFHNILTVNAPSEVPGHGMYRDWALPGLPFSYLALDAMCTDLQATRQPVVVAFADICAKPRYWNGGDNFSGQRFELADPRYPGILVQDMPNPCQLLYRMVDGRRRLEKLRRLAPEALCAYFWVYTYAEIQPYIRSFRFASGPDQDKAAAPQ